jgi:hypothetical protein
MAHEFCRTLLKLTRDDARENGVEIPKHLTALKQFDGQWFVEMDGRMGVNISGDCAYEAKAKYIASLVNIAEV